MSRFAFKSHGLSFFRGRHAVLLALALAGSSAAVGRADVEYNVVDLGVVGTDAFSSAAAINSNNLVVGESDSASGSSSQAAYSSGHSLLGIATLGGTQGTATAVNSAGIAAGYSSDASGDTDAFTANTNLATPTPVALSSFGGTVSYAYGINTAGAVVGASSYGTLSSTYACKWSGGVQTALDPAGFVGTGTSSVALGINDSNLIVGNRTTADGVVHGFVYSGSTPYDIGGLGGATTSAEAINNSNQIVGFTTDPSNAYNIAFLYTPTLVGGVLTGGTFTPLGSLGTGTNSDAHAINSLGQIVGESDTDFDGTHAFVYDNSTLGMEDLNDLISPAAAAQWDLSQAFGISSSGDITGVGEIDGTSHAFLLTPVPEPSTALIFVASTLAILRRPRRLL